MRPCLPPTLSVCSCPELGTDTCVAKANSRERRIDGICSWRSSERRGFERSRPRVLPAVRCLDFVLKETIFLNSGATSFALHFPCFYLFFNPRKYTVSSAAHGPSSGSRCPQCGGLIPRNASFSTSPPLAMRKPRGSE